MGENIKQQFKKVLKVIQKYNSKEQIIKIINSTETQNSYNLLSILLFLINDYYENGTYINSIDSTEINGNGEINWDKTINESFAFISNNKPFYDELKTNITINDDNNYIQRLYECILTYASQILLKLDILELFDITPVNISEPTIEQGKKLTGQPGIESITKQYMYELAFNEFINEHNINNVENYFLFPTDKEIITDKGNVFLNMLKKIGLKAIKIKFIPANLLYDCYINNQSFDISKIIQI